MDGWFLPFQISACWHDYVESDKINRNMSNVRQACLTSRHNALSSLGNPAVVVGGVGSNETLYIEGHGKSGFDMLYAESPKHPQFNGPGNEYIDAFRLARLLKKYRFRGGNIRLNVCNSAEANGFGKHLKDAMDAYGIAYKSIRGRIGKSQTQERYCKTYHDIRT